MPEATEQGLTGLRVLIAEDEMLLAVLIEDILIDQGCEIVGPFTTLAEADAGARAENFDFALLDVNLRGENSYPVARLVAERGVPFLLLSGYGASAVPPEHPEWHALGKPFGADQLSRAILARLRGR